MSFVGTSDTWIEQISVLKDDVPVDLISEMYIEVFGNSPWNEGYRCPACSNVYSLTTLHLTRFCRRCQNNDRRVLLVPYWTKTQVLSDLYQENLRPGSICLYARKSGVPQGFAWGYNLDIFDCRQIEAEGLGGLLPKVKQFFYLDECGVLPQFQKQGIGTALVQKIFSITTQSVLILRTLDDSPMQKMISHLGGRTLTQISAGRVIMILEKRQPNFIVFEDSSAIDH